MRWSAANGFSTSLGGEYGGLAAYRYARDQARYARRLRRKPDDKFYSAVAREIVKRTGKVIGEDTSIGF